MNINHENLMIFNKDSFIIFFYNKIVKMEQIGKMTLNHEINVISIDNDGEFMKKL